MISKRLTVLLSSTNPIVNIVNSLDQLQREKNEVRKEISEIKFVLFLMMKHKTTYVSKEELDKITDVEILLLCKFNEASLLIKLERKEIELTSIEQRLTSITTPTGKFISVYFTISNSIVFFYSCEECWCDQ